MLEKNKKILIGVAAFLFLSGVLLILSPGYFLDIFRQKAPVPGGPEQTSNQKGSPLGKDLEKLNAFTSKPTQESKSAYLDQLEEQLKSSTPTQWDRAQLLMRKALALSILVGSPSEKEVGEAMNIYRDFIASTDTSDGSIYMRDLAITAGTKLQLQLSQGLPNVSLIDPQRNTSYQKYKAAGYDDSLSTYLALFDLSQQVSAQNKLDTIRISEEVTLASLLIFLNNVQLQKSTYYQNILDTLKSDLQSMESGKLQALLYKDPISTTIEPKYHYALAYDAYYSRPGITVTGEINQKIDNLYQDAIDAAKNYPEFQKAQAGLNQVLFYSEIFYLVSLDRRYGANVDTAKLNVLAQDFISTVQSSQEAGTLAAWFISSSGKLNFKEHLSSIGKVNFTLNSYLVSLSTK